MYPVEHTTAKHFRLHCLRDRSTKAGTQIWVELVKSASQYHIQNSGTPYIAFARRPARVPREPGEELQPGHIGLSRCSFLSTEPLDGRHAWSDVFAGTRARTRPVGSDGCSSCLGRHDMWRALRARRSVRSWDSACVPRAALGDTTKTRLASLSLSRVSGWARASGYMLFGPLPRIHSVPLMMQRAGGSERMRVRCPPSTRRARVPLSLPSACLREQKGSREMDAPPLMLQAHAKLCRASCCGSVTNAKPCRSSSVPASSVPPLSFCFPCNPA